MGELINRIGCICILIFCFGCKESTKSNEVDSLPVASGKEQMLSRVDEEELKDSIRLSQSLLDALGKARGNLNRRDYETRYNLYFDSLNSIQIEIILGNLFGRGNKHLLVKRENKMESVFIDLFQVKKGEFIPSLNLEKESFTYIKDTIFDVNGDEEKDYLVHWYPSSGCCRRNIYDVFLSDSTSKGFLEKKKFVNPTFSPREKMIRGIGYGHPGEVGLYKYRWDRSELDTIEYIYPDLSRKYSFIKTATKLYRPTSKDGLSLRSVPEEYRAIESYDWFINY